MNRTMRTVCGLTIALTLAVFADGAQQPPAQTGFKRIPVQQGDLSIPGREAVQAIAEFQPGAEAGRHTHPGDEFSYILEGTITLEVDGKPAVMKKAGESFSIPAGTVHNARNTSKAVAKVFGTYIIEKGKPVASPAK